MVSLNFFQKLLSFKITRKASLLRRLQNESVLKISIRSAHGKQLVAQQVEVPEELCATIDLQHSSFLVDGPLLLSLQTTDSDSHRNVLSLEFSSDTIFVEMANAPHVSIVP